MVLVSWQLTPYALPSLVAGSLCLVLGALSWQRGRDQGRVLAILLLASGWWSLLQTLGVSAVDLSAKVWFAKIQYLGIVVVPPAWLVLAVRYCGYGGWLTRRRTVLLMTFPAATLAAVFTNDWHGLIWRWEGLVDHGSFVGLSLGHGPWFWWLSIVQ